MTDSKQREIKRLAQKDFPRGLLEIPDPPRRLFLRGALPEADKLLLTVVGSRKCTRYGEEAARAIITGLAGYPFAIVSGLALGIDGIAHRAALEAGLEAVAIPGSGLDDSVLYPRAHLRLAHNILDSGGALLSEMEPCERAAPHTFPKRNRLMAGMSGATLVVEADERSGSLITARLALEYNRDVLAVPGTIFSRSSRGTNALIRDGATPVAAAEDVLRHFGLESAGRTISDANPLPPNERLLLECLCEPRSRDELVKMLKLPVSEVSVLVTELEVKGLIKNDSGVFHAT